MSIASEFDSTIENIKSDYEGLENLGADLTNVNKNIQNIRTCLDNIYTNLPKTTGEGSNLSLTTLKGRINTEAVKGDTEQDTYEGYNLLPTSVNRATYGGITAIKNEDGSYKVTGTATTNAILYILNESDNITLPSGSYYLSGCPSGGTSETYRIVISVGGTLYGEYGSGRAITTTASGKLSAYIYVGAGTTVNLTYYPMLTSGSAQKPYEQYTGGTASPNPSYPQDINVVTGTQEVRINGTNIYDSSYRTPDNTILCAGGTCTEENGVFTIQCNRNDMYVWNVQNNGATYSAYQNQLIDFIENTYTVTITNSLFTKNFITFYDADKKVLNFKQFNTNSFTFTKGQDYSVPSEAKYFSLRFGINDSVSGTTYTTRVQIEVGSTATPYTPYQEQTNTLHLGDIELCKIGTYQDRIYKNNDKWYIEKNIGHKKASEITENDIGGVGGSQSVYFTSSFTNVIANRTLQVYSNVQTWKNTTDTEWNTLNGNYIGVLFNVQQIYINKTASTKSELITWLNSINFEMYYVLSTPTYEEITNETLLNELNEIEKMMSYNGQTNISVSGNLPMILDVSALKGE